ncbi:hypothetical protein AAGS40_19950 [Paraburkholderia sp. PREW-6R]|uniref:hypothetical protein n=1 Tax=Paraburkholderia sp. PREW-6R TaxID=3141544 RepID=UPI0031F54359
MRRLIVAALAALSAGCLALPVYAQSSAPGPFNTVEGKLEFVRADEGFAAMLDHVTLDRFQSHTLIHFDEAADAHENVARMLVQTDAGPVLYDFRSHPPRVLQAGRRLTVRRVFWQGDEVVMQSSQGWFRFERGTLTKLQSSTTTYH